MMGNGIYITKSGWFLFSSYVNNNVDAEFVVSGTLTLMPKVSKHNSITISDQINDIIIFANVFSIANHFSEFLKHCKTQGNLFKFYNNNIFFLKKAWQ